MAPKKKSSQERKAPKPALAAKPSPSGSHQSGKREDQPSYNPAVENTIVIGPAPKVLKTAVVYAASTWDYCRYYLPGLVDMTNKVLYIFVFFLAVWGVYYHSTYETDFLCVLPQHAIRRISYFVALNCDTTAWTCVKAYGPLLVAVVIIGLMKGIRGVFRLVGSHDLVSESAWLARIHRTDPRMVQESIHRICGTHRNIANFNHSVNSIRDWVRAAYTGTNLDVLAYNAVFAAYSSDHHYAIFSALQRDRGRELVNSEALMDGEVAGGKLPACLNT